MAKNNFYRRMNWLHWWSVVCWAFSFFISPPYLLPQKTIKFEHITIEHGLSQNTVFVILQDSKGFLWLGTEDGLNRFDGYNFKVYTHNPDEPGTLSNNWIQAIYEDKSGVLWIGTRGGGLNRFDRATQTFKHYMHDPSDPDSLNNNIVCWIHEDQSGLLWIGTNSGLSQMDRTNETFIHWGAAAGNPNSLSHHKAQIIYEDGPGILWIGTLGGGLNRFDGKRRSFSHYLPNPNNIDSRLNVVRAICEDKTGQLLVGTDNGLNTFDRERGVFAAWGSPILRNTIIMSIYEDRSGVLWVATYGNGLIRLDPEAKTVTRYKHKPANTNSISSDYIQCIYEDKTGILWVGTDSGLNKYDKNKLKFGHCETEPDKPNSLCNNKVWSICKDGTGTLWIGSEGGLDCLDREKKRFVHVKIGSSTGNPDNKKITSICECVSGFLWIGTYKDGLYRLDRKKKNFKFRHYVHDPANPQSLSFDCVNTICENKAAELWVGTAEGLNKFDRQRGTFTRYKNLAGKRDSLSDNYINAIYEDRSGVLWIGTKDGLNRFNREKGTFSHWKRQPGNRNTLSSNIISSIRQVRPGILWIGTWGGGLNKFDRENGTFKHYLEKDGLPNSFIHGILVDKGGNLWISTNKGISKFDPETEIFKNYDVRDGLQSNEFNSGACYKSNDDEMFFGGIRGFNAFSPNDIEDNPHKPAIVITDFQVLNEPVKIGEDYPLKKDITETEEIVLSYRDDVFSFDFAALDFTNPEKNRYAYMMEGFDRDWIYRDAKKRFATYTNLDPGEYRFRVIGSNNDGVWNQEGTAIKIIIVPPFWKTWWFRLLLLASFAVLSYVVINFVKNYIAFSGFWKKEKYIGNFKLLEKIGSGGMSTIYRALDTLDKSQTVAIKVLREEFFADEGHRKRFKAEAAIIDQLDHPNIVKIFERGQHKQKLFIVMELLKGRTLAKKIEEEDKIDFREVLEIMIQISDALAKIHKKQIVHRDLKPDNIMLIERGGATNFVKLLDFGLARMQFQSRITQSGTVLGTLNYMSPEQIAEGKFSLASDIYSLGVIFYETATGQVPFPGEGTTDIMSKVLNKAPVEPIRLRPDLPFEYNEITMQMLEKISQSRPTVEEVMATLDSMR